MNLKEFSRVNRERCESPNGFNHALNSWSLSDWITALVGELGEAANVAKKLNRVRDGIPGNTVSPDELRAQFARELADTFIYLDLTAQAAGVDLPAAVVAVFNAKSEQIGSPIRFGVPVTAAAGEHTPGPWRAVPGSGGSLDVLACPPGDAEGTLIAETYICDREKANANLIAAAPDLLAACKAMYAELRREYGHCVANGYWPDMKPKLEAWAAAIAKAEGGAAPEMPAPAV